MPIVPAGAPSVTLGLFLAASLSAPLPGQGVVPPLEVGRVNPLPGLSQGALPATGILQLHLVHLPGAPANIFYCAATVTGLSPTYGGAGGYDLLCGSYDVLTDTFTPTGEAAALNTPSRDAGLMMHHSGRFAVFVDPAQNVWLAARPAAGQPWQVRGQIYLCPCAMGLSWDPALADYRGQMHLLYVHGADIVMAPLDPINATVTGPPTVIVSPPGGTISASAPIPVTDSNGELVGVSHSARTTQGDSDHYLSLDLEPGTPPVLLNDATSHTWPGGNAGGRFFGVESTTSTPLGTHTFVIDTFWCTGGRAPVGGVMSVRLMVPPTSGTQVYQSVVVASPAFLPVGTPLPPLLGVLGISASGAWASNPVLHNNSNGEAQVQVPVPNSAGLSGVRLPIQSATLELTTGVVYLGNTATLVVE